MKKIVILLVLGSFWSCSPLASTADEKQHQEELTLHEIQTNLDDLRHDLNRFQTELSISDDKMRYQEKCLSSLKEQELKELKNLYHQLLDRLDKETHALRAVESEQYTTNHTLNALAEHAKDTNSALVQYKKRCKELEKQIAKQQSAFQEVAKIRSYLEEMIEESRKNDPHTVYRVKAGDSLEKIARTFHVSVESIKEVNGLSKDVIIVGQELKIP